MGKILKFIAKETQGECFTSFKYCYDNVKTPTIEYENGENSYTSNPQLSSSASFLRLNVLSSLN